jgi:hypothetical protein
MTTERQVHDGRRVEEVVAMSDETFEIDTELTREAISAGIWSRMCSEMAGNPENAIWRPRVEPLAKRRGEDATALLTDLADTDVDYLADARRMCIAVAETPLGSKVQLDDISRFMPKAWHEAANEWVYSGYEREQIESRGGHVTGVRTFGTHEQLRGD